MPFYDPLYLWLRQFINLRQQIWWSFLYLITLDLSYSCWWVACYPRLHLVPGYVMSSESSVCAILLCVCSYTLVLLLGSQMKRRSALLGWRVSTVAPFFWSYRVSSRCGGRTRLALPPLLPHARGLLWLMDFPGLYFCKFFRAYNTVLSINIMYGRLRACWNYGYNEGFNDLWFWFGSEKDHLDHQTIRNTIQKTIKDHQSGPNGLFLAGIAGSFRPVSLLCCSMVLRLNLGSWCVGS